MGRFRGLGLKRARYLPLRLTENERQALEERARESELSMAEYARCKIFDIPLRRAEGNKFYNRPRKATPPAKAT